MKFIDNLASLIKVKTIVTLSLISVFMILSLRGEVPADSLTNIVLMVISFYFGTQMEGK